MIDDLKIVIRQFFDVVWIETEEHGNTFVIGDKGFKKLIYISFILFFIGLNLLSALIAGNNTPTWFLPSGFGYFSVLIKTFIIIKFMFKADDALEVTKKRDREKWFLPGSFPYLYHEELMAENVVKKWGEI